MSCNDVMWEPNEGEPLPIHDMGDNHLINAWRKLKLVEQTGPQQGFPDFRGEMAQEAAEMQFFAAEDAYQHLTSTLLPALEGEISRRQLRVDHVTESGNIIRRRLT